MASGREKRITAGNRLSKVLNEEVEADEFYATTYGGFNEIENDDDYKSEEEGDDQVDSDFSIEENDEVISDNEGEESSKKRKGVNTKAYKDPKGAKTSGKAEKRKSKDKSEKKESAKKIRTESRDSLVERKSLRKATVEKSAEIAKRIKERSQIKKKLPLKKNEYYKPTQEELLEEAKITEQENIKSLERYQKMELEKKKCRIVKKVYTGPTIKYHSLTMPLIQEIKPTTRSNSRTISESEISIDVVKTEDSDVEVATTITVSDDIKTEIPDESNSTNQVDEENKETTNKKQDSNTECSNDNNKDKDEKDKNVKDVGLKCERTLITFSDEATFKSACPWANSKPTQPPPIKICPFTRQKAKYFDPVSQTPYNTIQAFKVLRETYSMQLEKAINNNTVEGVDKETLNKWLAWRQKEKENKLRKLSVLPQNVQGTATVVQPVTPVTAALPS